MLMNFMNNYLRCWWILWTIICSWCWLFPFWIVFWFFFFFSYCRRPKKDTHTDYRSL